MTAHLSPEDREQVRDELVRLFKHHAGCCVRRGMTGALADVAMDALLAAVPEYARLSIANCSRCGEMPVVNLRPDEDVVVCEACMWEQVSEADQDGWGRGHAWGESSRERYRLAWLSARRRANK